MKNNAAAFLCLWAKSKEFFVRSGTERYGESLLKPISHDLPLQWAQMGDVGISCHPPLFSVILRKSPYKPSLRSFGPVRQVRRVRQKNSARSYSLLRHKSEAEAEVAAAIAR